ncbi:tetratricopeptide repeat protein [Tardiphaga sp.]|uniref:tetratricopeptide repeat protein n=1 Tax=Tardiphaga sp. TaxID=1926292 RepID=UPI00352A2B9C
MAISNTINQPGMRQAALERAVALFNEGQFHGAEALLQTIANGSQGSAFVQHMRGLVAAGLGQTERAQELLSIAIKLDPADATVHANLGVLLLRESRYAPAAAAFEAALLLQPQHQIARLNVAKCYAELGLFDLAIDAYRDALACMPDHFELQADLAALLSDTGDTEGSLALFARVLAREPERAEIHTALAVSLFTSGDWVSAWHEYEWRWRDPRYQHAPATVDAPRWTGESLAEKTILLQAEQGLGDTIQFVRYAALVKARGARVVLQAERALIPLLRTVAGIDQFADMQAPAPACDVWAPLMSLPGLFGTVPDNVPGELPYLHADAELTARWKQRLGLEPGLAVGIVWQGNPAHACDRWRSMPLAALRPLFACPAAQFVSLQFGAGHEQFAGAGCALLDPGEKHEISSFADTAAIVANLDLVISIDSAVAHLAGALAKPVWILLAARNDWRWMRRCETTPWYPQARLFRQHTLHDWDTVVLEVRQALWSWVRAEPPIDAAEIPRRRTNDDALSHALFARGVRHHRDNDSRRSKTCFDRLLLNDPDHVNALCNLGALERADGNNDRALALTQRAVELAPELIDARLALADALVAASRIEDATAQYRDALRRAPRSAPAHAAFALASRANGDFETALKHFEHAVQLDQRQSPAFYLALGQTLVAMQQLAGAEISLRYALALDPTLALAREALEAIRQRVPRSVGTHASQ